MPQSTLWRYAGLLQEARRHLEAATALADRTLPFGWSVDAAEIATDVTHLIDAAFEGRVAPGPRPR
jgi:hypothetical protein